MEKILEVINWFQANWENIALAITSVVTTASVIVKITPTLKDDNFLKPIVAFIGKYIAINKSISAEEQAKVNNA